MRAARTPARPGCRAGPATTGWCTSPSRTARRGRAREIVVTVEVTDAAPHHLIADAALTGGTYAVRRTRAGDAWEQRRAERVTPETPQPASAPVALGLPSRR